MKLFKNTPLKMMVFALLAVLTMVSCNRKDVFYPSTPDDDGSGGATSELLCKVTIPLDWSGVEDKLPLLTSSNLYVYDENGQFISKHISKGKNDFVIELEKGKKYNFFISDNLLTAQQEGDIIRLENTDDFFKLNFEGTSYSSDSHLNSEQGAIKPFSYATLADYTVPNTDTATTDTVKPVLGSVDVELNLDNYVALWEIETDNLGNIVDVYWNIYGDDLPAISPDDFTITEDAEGNYTITVVTQSIKDAALKAAKDANANFIMQLGLNDFKFSLGNQRGNLAVQNPDFSYLPVTTTVDYNNMSISSTVNDDIKVFARYNAPVYNRTAAPETPSKAATLYVGIRGIIKTVFQTFGYIKDKKVLPFDYDNGIFTNLVIEYYDRYSYRPEIVQTPLIVIPEEYLQTIMPNYTIEDLMDGQFAIYKLVELNGRLTYVISFPTEAMFGNNQE